MLRPHRIHAAALVLLLCSGCATLSPPPPVDILPTAQGFGANLSQQRGER